MPKVSADGAKGLSRDPAAAVAANELWYHTMELAPGVVTPGWFDVREAIAKLPWPEVRGKRCLDVGTYDGQLAFELERRGAAEVVATDIAEHEGWDWPPRTRSKGPEILRDIAGPEKGRGFEIARELLASQVERRAISVYDLDPDAVGSFDVVVCGSLLLHLRDPFRALEAIRSVCSGFFLSVEQVELRTTLRHPRSPVLLVDGTSERLQWLLPNVAGHRQMLRAGGFDIERESGIYSERYGVSHPVGRGPRERAVSLARRIFTGNDGVPHHAVLARPAV
jgi:tRNA (mo5U34)-methyltransferase